MDKQQALKELQELKARADALEVILNALELPKTMHGIFLEPSVQQTQYYINKLGDVIPCNGVNGTDLTYGLAFATREAAENHMKQRVLHQRCRKAMSDDWGGQKVTWGIDTGTKYCISNDSENTLYVAPYETTYSPFHFRTKEAAVSFIKSLSKEEVQIFLRGSDV